jgi:hypothetical protein
MLQNNNIDTKENKQITNQVEEKENYFEKIVNIRLYHRKKVKKFSILIFVSNSIYFILGMLLFFAAYITRFFIYDPDEFWKQIMNKPSLLILQKFSAGSGIYICCFSLFSIMDNIVIYILLNKGGLKRRLYYGIYILLIMEIINIILNLYSICCFKNILILFPIIFIYSFFSLGITLIYFILIKKSCNSENLFLLSIERLIKYIEDTKSYKDIKME